MALFRDDNDDDDDQVSQISRCMLRAVVGRVYHITDRVSLEHCTTYPSEADTHSRRRHARQVGDFRARLVLPMVNASAGLLITRAAQRCYMYLTPGRSALLHTDCSNYLITCLFLHCSKLPQLLASASHRGMPYQSLNNYISTKWQATSDGGT